MTKENTIAIPPDYAEFVLMFELTKGDPSLISMTKYVTIKQIVASPQKWNTYRKNLASSDLSSNHVAMFTIHYMHFYLSQVLSESQRSPQQTEMLLELDAYLKNSAEGTAKNYTIPNQWWFLTKRIAFITFLIFTIGVLGAHMQVTALSETNIVQNSLWVSGTSAFISVAGAALAVGGLASGSFAAATAGTIAAGASGLHYATTKIVNLWGGN